MPGLEQPAGLLEQPLSAAGVDVDHDIAHRQDGGQPVQGADTRLREHRLTVRDGRLECQVEREDVDPRLAEQAEPRPAAWASISSSTRSTGGAAQRGRRVSAWYRAAAMLISGSRPLAEAVTRSTGTGAVLPGSAARSASIRPLTASASAGFNGPWFEPLEALALFGYRRRRRRSAPEVLRIAEGLADQQRADGLAVAHDEAAGRLVRERRLRRRR